VSEKGNLYLVATPIGNLNDFSPRGLESLSMCDLIACEDTRITQKILSHFKINKPLISYREENEKKQAKNLIGEIKKGRKVALVSDAGYPGISDPGFRLVRECRRSGLKIVNVPGANAAITAIASSGLPTHNFVFLGFPPKGKNAFINILKKWSDFQGSLIFYQSKYKMPSTYEIISDVYGDNRFIAVARELTKLHETFIVGKIPEVEKKARQSSQKGEFTIVIAPEGFVL
tara:strand:+ start:93 stop:785 length:693 start_codon:yes stop_codon:yes gene_type:complete